MFPRWLPVLVLVLTGAPALPAAAAPAELTATEGRVSVLETTGDIQTVVVALPEIADATVTGPRKLFLLGRKPGRTGLLVIGTDGSPLLQTTVTVAPEDAGTVTVNRGARESTFTCTPRCAETDTSKAAQKDTGGTTPAAPATPTPAPPTAQITR